MKTLALILGLISDAWNLIYKVALLIIAIVIVVGLVKSCTANATLDEHSSCQQFDQADATTQDKILQDMMATHHSQDSLSLTRLSLRLYCNVNGGNSPIDGIYNGGNASQQLQ